MDVVGTITGVIDLFAVAHQIQGLVDKYKNAPKAVRDIVEECQWTRALCLSLKDEYLRAPDALQAGADSRPKPAAQQRRPEQDLLWCFDKSMQGIRETLEELEREAGKLQNKNNCVMGRWDRTKFLWKEEYFKDTAQSVRDQRGMVAMVISGIQLHKTNKINKDIQKVLAIIQNGQVSSSKSTSHVDQLQPPSAIKKSKSDTQIKKGTVAVEDLSKAIRGGRLVDVEPILAQGPSTDMALGDHGDRAVHIAARHGFLPILDRLLAYGADVNLQNTARETALHQALQCAQTPTALTLLANGASWSITDATGATALHIAAEKSAYLVVQYLLDRGADPNVRDNLGRTPLFQACHPLDKEGKKSKVVLKVIRALVQGGAEPTIGAQSSGSTPVHELAMTGMARELEVAARGIKSVDLPLEGSCKGTTPLHLAVRNNHREAAEILIKLGANVNAKQTSKGGTVPTALWQAAWNKNFDMATKLLESGADPKVTGKDDATVLHLVVAKRWPEWAKLLVRFKADVNAQAADKNTPLHFAVSSKDTAMTRVLLDIGAKPDVAGPNSATPFMYAAQAGSLPLIRLLLERGAEWSYRTPQGTDAFIWACGGGHIACASFLLGCGHDLHTKSTGNYTALHYAARKGNMECVRWLLELGVDKSIRATKLRVPFKAVGTAAEVAKAHGADDVAAFIDKYAGDIRY
ncbi:Ankyrin-2 [Colletotrichum chlorophyti]|uniref:Ankyrin-2 n=1 Tax=Colletotrichum chlorophyti TaxID=708187 RepID=A0A1Q8REY6_9PEZI|nr:Ankyrin-2 [Colletotrichum chlorophyti]